MTRIIPQLQEWARGVSSRRHYSSEREFMNGVAEYAEAEGWLAIIDWRSSGTRGLPDVMLWRDDRYVLAELKLRVYKSGKHKSAGQGLFRNRAAAFGVTVYMWTPDDWPQIIEVLEG